MDIDNKFEGIKEHLDNAAIVLDVRTKEEYDDGHVENSVHIVLDELKDKIEYLKELERPIITCCRSGARSERAKEILIEYDVDAINGGPWQNVDNFL
ncbi:MAG: rhodanese-like domain-containing protein [Bacteroidia bacterium]|nr:rhodanese-like domain-containing protein [Bacteroidia bacterium]NND11192.1 rhodanese-like domain-containing protein [Flavobacteriaceae bacterium]MBT8308990.1 rhodanese-like domain-containing protein [Bacteroidia bacterium]NNK28307.1 rhodanese-like domain-containing protein [Flavobacteriaceae bacterium]NNL60585.1 rhodanese-like domain-containing protein [Flavobacteriaceae bacterium]